MYVVVASSGTVAGFQKESSQLHEVGVFHAIFLIWLRFLLCEPGSKLQNSMMTQRYIVPIAEVGVALVLETNGKCDSYTASKDGGGSSEGLQGQLGHSRDAMATGATPSNTGTKHHHHASQEDPPWGPVGVA